MAVIERNQTANTNSVKFYVSPSSEKDVPKIAEMINAEAKRSGAVLPVFEDEVRGWIKEGLSFVAKNESGEILGHHSAHIWPVSGWAELRAAVVLPEYRGYGINGTLKDAIIKAIHGKDDGASIVSVKNKSSNGRQILSDLGFKEIARSDAPQELFGIGPKDAEYDIYQLTPANNVVKSLVRA